MKKFIPIFLTLLLLGGCVPASAPEQTLAPSVLPSASAPFGTAFSVYDDGVATFEYPADWISVDSPVAGGVSFAAPVARGTFPASVSIIRQDPGLTFSFAQFKQLASAQYAQLNAVYTQTDITLGGKDALYYDITLPAEYSHGTELRMVQYVLQKDSAFYVLAMLETQEAFPLREALFAYIGQTFDVR